MKWRRPTIVNRFTVIFVALTATAVSFQSWVFLDLRRTFGLNEILKRLVNVRQESLALTPQTADPLHVGLLQSQLLTDLEDLRGILENAIRGFDVTNRMRASMLDAIGDIEVKWAYLPRDDGLKKHFDPRIWLSVAELTSSLGNYIPAHMERLLVGLGVSLWLNIILAMASYLLVVMPLDKRKEQALGELVQRRAEVDALRVQLISLIEDIRVERNMTISLEGRFRVALEASPAGMMVVDEDGRFEYVNRKLLEYSGYDENELIGMHVETLVPERFREQQPSVLQNFMDTPAARTLNPGLLMLLRRKDGTEVPVEIALTPTRQDRGRLLIVGAVIDISNRLNQEKMLRDSNIQLLAANRDLDEFTYIVSHDLKSPLRGISHLVRWIEEDRDTKLSTASVDYFSKLKERVSKLNMLLDGLLEYSRIGRQPAPSEDVSLQTLFKEIWDLVAVNTHFRLALPEQLPTIRCNRAALETVLRNIVQNAIHHHDLNEGTITVSAERADAYWEIRIADDGPGIPAAFRSMAFQVFKTLKPTGSTGMGLSIVKRIIAKEHGRISIEDNHPRGTVFRIEWPVG